MDEALRPVIAYGFARMTHRLIEATVEPQNRKSIRLLSKLGFFKQKQLGSRLVLFTLECPSA